MSFGARPPTALRSVSVPIQVAASVLGVRASLPTHKLDAARSAPTIGDDNDLASSVRRHRGEWVRMDESQWIGVRSPQFQAIAERIKVATRLSSKLSEYQWDEPELGPTRLRGVDRQAYR